METVNSRQPEIVKLKLLYLLKVSWYGEKTDTIQNQCDMKRARSGL